MILVSWLEGWVLNFDLRGHSLKIKVQVMIWFHYQIASMSWFNLDGQIKMTSGATPWDKDLKNIKFDSLFFPHKGL